MKSSSGILLFRRGPAGLQFLLVHPGGPFFRNKDSGAWTIPKGEVEDGEDLLAAAQREYHEELGADISAKPSSDFRKLTPVKQKSGKIVHAWALLGDLDVTQIRSNTFKMEWPPKSGKQSEFPEIDRAEFFDLAAAKIKINSAQAAMLDELVAMVG